MQFCYSPTNTPDERYSVLCILPMYTHQSLQHTTCSEMYCKVPSVPYNLFLALRGMLCAPMQSMMTVHGIIAIPHSGMKPCSPISCTKGKPACLSW